MKPKSFSVEGAQFREWLEAMRRAQAYIEQEKAEWLRQLTPEQSRAIYLALWEWAKRPDPKQPSEFIMRLQKMFQRMVEAQSRESARTGTE